MLAALLLLVCAVGFPWVDDYLRAAGLLLRFEGNPPDDGVLGWIASYREAEVTVREESYSGGRLRLYLPDGAATGRPTVALVHGVHPEGIDERRLVRFARTIANAGAIVATPELPRLTQFELPADAVAQIRIATREVAERTERVDVGVIGISFSGGLALLAATEPDARIRFVVSLGGHHDLARVLEWYLGAPAADPSGATLEALPHPYGIGVFLHAHAHQLFASTDADVVRSVLGELLAGRREAAYRIRREAVLTREGATRLDTIIRYVRDRTDNPAVEALKEEVQSVIHREAERLARVSPAGHLDGIECDVFVIHGLSDPIVPSTEAAWLRRDLPESRLRSVLVTDVIRHAEYGRDPAHAERWAMVRTMAKILRAAR